MKTTSVMRISSCLLCCILSFDSLIHYSGCPLSLVLFPILPHPVSLAFDCHKSVDDTGPDTEHYQISSRLTLVHNNCFLDTSAERGFNHFYSSCQKLKKYFLQFGILLITTYIVIGLIILVCFFTFAKKFFTFITFLGFILPF